MPETFTFLRDLAGFAALGLGLVLTLRNIKKTSPTEEMRQRQDALEEKLENDHRRLKHLERGEEERGSFERLTLHCLKGILEHLATGNHTDAMRGLTKDIDAYLIAR